MPAELATVAKETRLATPAPEFSNDQIRLLGETVAKGCDQNELAFFLHVAKLKRLDPFTGQIHVVKRWDSSLGKEKMTVQVGIDGFRVIASRTDDLAGIDDPDYDTEDQEHPNVAKVTVYRYGRNDERIPYRATARWAEYAQTKKDGTIGPMWKKLPYLMLGKCAEALALRKAFPDELSGMYTNEEMDQAENETPAQSGKKAPVTQPSRASDKKPESAQQTQTAPEKGKMVETSGVIENAKQGGNGMLWLTIKSHKPLVCVPADKIDGDMAAGAFIKFRGSIWNNPKIGDYWQLDGLIELQKVQEGEVVKDQPEKKLAPDAAAVADEIFGDKPQGQAAVAGMVENGTLKPASALPAQQTEATKPGTVGLKRAKRLHTLISQNHKTTGFTEAECYKMLSALPNALQHMRDIEIDMYPTFERYATGEEDWKEFWKD